MIKDMIGLLTGVVLGGHTMGQVGSNLTGNLAGIGRATQSMIGAGILSHSTKLCKWK